MEKHTYLCLLRGINVGGKNSIPMASLKKAFEDMGFTEVSTYIQSGNVIFTTLEKDPIHLEDMIENSLSKTFQYASRVVVLSHHMFKQVHDEKPKGFGMKPEEYSYDVLFLKQPKKASEIRNVITTRDGVDWVSEGTYALYFSRLKSQASHSKLSKFISKPEYKFVTIRNWNTFTKLLTYMSVKT